MTQTVLLGDLIEDIAMGPFGSNLKTDNFIRSGVPVVRGGNLYKAEVGGDFVFVSEEKAQSLKRSLAYPDDIIITHRGTLGQVSIVPHGEHPYYLASQSQLRFTPNLDLVNPRYLLYYLRSKVGQHELMQHTSQVGVPSIATPTKAVKSFKIVLPNLETQKKIADILGTIDEKIELNRRMNETCEQMGQALFRHYFIDNPEAEKWEEKTIYEFSDVIYGAPFASKLFNETGEGRPLIRIRDLKTQKPGYWTTEDHPKGTLITAGDIVVGMDAEFRPHIWAAETAWLNQRVCQFLPKDGISKLFVFESIRPWLNFYEKGKIGTTVIHLGKSDIDKFKIKNPPTEILEEFSKLADPIYDMRVKNSLEIQTLTTLRDTLLPRLINGKMKV